MNVQPKNLLDLHDAIKSARTKIPEESSQDLIESVPQRIQAVYKIGIPIKVATVCKTMRQNCFKKGFKDGLNANRNRTKKSYIVVPITFFLIRLV